MGLSILQEMIKNSLDKVDIQLKQHSYILVRKCISLQVYRNVVLTGYPLYPKSFLSFPVEWKVPSKYLKTLNDGLKMFPVGLPRTNPNYNQDRKAFLS